MAVIGLLASTGNSRNNQTQEFHELRPSDFLSSRVAVGRGPRAGWSAVRVLRADVDEGLAGFVVSRATQWEHTEALVRGYRVIVTEFFDAGQSRMVALRQCPQAAALVADTGRGGDAIVIGEYERAFYRD